MGEFYFYGCWVWNFLRTWREWFLSIFPPLVYFTPQAHKSGLQQSSFFFSTPKTPCVGFFSWNWRLFGFQVHNYFMALIFLFHLLVWTSFLCTCCACAGFFPLEFHVSVEYCLLGVALAFMPRFSLWMGSTTGSGWNKVTRLVLTVQQEEENSSILNTRVLQEL